MAIGNSWQSAKKCQIAICQYKYQSSYEYIQSDHISGRTLADCPAFCLCMLTTISSVGRSISPTQSICNTQQCVILGNDFQSISGFFSQIYKVSFSAAQWWTLQSISSINTSSDRIIQTKCKSTQKHQKSFSALQWHFFYAWQRVNHYMIIDSIGGH